MDTLMKANVFFFVTTIAVVLVTLAILVVSFYVVKALEQARCVLEEVEEHVGETSDEVKELIFDLRESFVYRFLFKKKRKK